MSALPIDPRTPDSTIRLPSGGPPAGFEHFDNRSKQQTDADAERFEKAFQEGSQDEPEGEQKNPLDTAQHPGDSILNSFFGQIRGPADPAGTAPGTTLSDMAAEVADRILVSEPGQDPEIRIQIKDSLLAGTEIIIRRQNGSWQIECHTVSADSARLLLAEKESFQTTLRQRLQDDQLVVTVSESQQASGDSHDGRSSQYSAISGEPDQLS